jgi:hypothetical protein
VSSRARPRSAGVGPHLPEYDVGEAAFEGAHGFHRGFPGGELAPEVGASCGVVAQLDDPGDVEDMVEAAVPGA